ncbi:MAG TPA: TonB-dependent receptor [Gammaproteobacteria bacterium]
MRRRALPCAFAIGGLLAATSSAAQERATSLADLSLEELGQIEVLSVSRRPEPLAGAPASIYVITAEQIRRSGATSLGEALRLAPNLQVARIDSAQYAISARGFNNAVGNKLLVLIDGRTVYTPLYSGVFWDQQDVLLADVDRIEVFSGPGATLWGANAVNGVINVITRSAAETQRGLVSVAAGDFEDRLAVRYGGRLGEHGHYRVYGKSVHAENTVRASGVPAVDEWQRHQAGFRADWSRDRDVITVQADAYTGHSQDRGMVLGIDFGRIEVSGANVLGRWTRLFDNGSELRVQSYFDHAERDDALFFRPDADTFDVEVQHGLSLSRHDFLWGGGYRRSSDRIGAGVAARFIPESRDLDWWNVFVQDRIAFGDKVEMTLGLKLESNDYTGTESLPSVRIAFKPTAQRLVWGALSRAVRAPSRFDRDVFFPGSPPFLLLGGPNFQAEVADVVEIGYRVEAFERFGYSVTVFHHDWDKLRSGTAVPAQLENRIEGTVAGVEAWATWRVTDAWILRGGFFTLDEDLRLEPGSTDPVGVENDTLANDPEQQWVIGSSLDLTRRLELDVNVRSVGSLPHPHVPRYTAVDARLAWRARPDLSFELLLQNLFDEGHPEFGPPPVHSEIPRSALLDVSWRFGG